MAVRLKMMGAIAAATILGFSSVAWANMITPLWFVRGVHLWLGNALIGVLEGIVLGTVLRAPVARCIWIMILANYLSMIAGLVLVAWLAGNTFAEATVYDLSRIAQLHWLLLLVAFVASIFIEWPFCFWVLSGRPGRTTRGLKASAILQVVSYAIVVPLYLWIGDLSAFRLNATPDVVKQAGDDFQVYYVSLDRKQVRSVRLDGVGDHGIAEDTSRGELGNLLLQRADIHSRWELCTSNGYSRQDKPLVQGLGLRVPMPLNDPEVLVLSSYISSRFLGTRYWDPSDHQRWAVSHHYQTGVKARDPSTGQTVKVALDLPYLHWRVFSATALPGGRVVFQLEDQICLLDVSTRRIGLLARGQNPIVVPTTPALAPVAGRP